MSKSFRCDRFVGDNAFPVQIEHELGDVAIPAFLAKRGWYLYLNADGEGFHWERVDNETLYDIDSLRSLQNRPLTVGHTPRTITPQSWADLVAEKYIVGTVNPREKQDIEEGRLGILCNFSSQHGLDAIANRLEAEMSAKYSTELAPLSDNPRDDSFRQIRRRYEEGAIMKKGQKGRHGSKVGLLSRETFNADTLRKDSADLKRIGIDDRGIYYPLKYDSLTKGQYFDLHTQTPLTSEGDKRMTTSQPGANQPSTRQVLLGTQSINVDSADTNYVATINQKLQDAQPTVPLAIAGKSILLPRTCADEVSSAVGDLTKELEEAKSRINELEAENSTQKTALENFQAKEKESPKTDEAAISALLQGRIDTAQKVYPLLSQAQQGLQLPHLLTVPALEQKKAFVVAATNGAVKFDEKTTPAQVEDAFRGAYGAYSGLAGANVDAFSQQSMQPTLGNLLPSLSGQLPAMPSLGQVIGGIQAVQPVQLANNNPLLNTGQPGSGIPLLNPGQGQEALQQQQAAQREAAYQAARMVPPSGAKK